MHEREFPCDMRRRWELSVVLSVFVLTQAASVNTGEQSVCAVSREVRGGGTVICSAHHIWIVLFGDTVS